MKEYTGKEMNFTSNQQEIFKQNINALVNEILRKKLQKIKNTKFGRGGGIKQVFMASFGTGITFNAMSLKIDFSKIKNFIEIIDFNT